MGEEPTPRTTNTHTHETYVVAWLARDSITGYLMTSRAGAGGSGGFRVAAVDRKSNTTVIVNLTQFQSVMN